MKRVDNSTRTRNGSICAVGFDSRNFKSRCLKTFSSCRVSLITVSYKARIQLMLENFQ